MINAFYFKPIALAGLFLSVSSMMQAIAETEVKPPKKPDLKLLTTKTASNFTKQIDRSTSPSKKLVVALGSPDGSKPKWEKLPHGKIKGVERYSFTLDDGTCGNYLIDISKDRVIAILDGAHFGTFHQYNHESAMYAWSANSQWLVETQSWKWNTGTCSIHRLSVEGKPIGKLDFMPIATHIVSDWLQKKYPKLSAEDRSGYEVTVQTLSISNDGTVTAKISAERPKDEESKYVVLSTTVKVEVAVAAGTAKLTANVTTTTAVKQ